MVTLQSKYKLLSKVCVRLVLMTSTKLRYMTKLMASSRIFVLSPKILELTFYWPDDFFFSIAPESGFMFETFKRPFKISSWCKHLTCFRIQLSFSNPSTSTRLNSLHDSDSSTSSISNWNNKKLCPGLSLERRVEQGWLKREKQLKLKRAWDFLENRIKFRCHHEIVCSN